MRKKYAGWEIYMKKKLMAVLLALSIAIPAALPTNQVTALAAEAPLTANTAQDYQNQKNQAAMAGLPITETNETEAGERENNTPSSTESVNGNPETSDESDFNSNNQTSSSESETPLTEKKDETEITEPNMTETEITEKVTEPLTKPEEESADISLGSKQQRGKANQTEVSSSDKVNTKNTTYTITYILNGGKNALGNPASYLTSQNVTLRTPSRNGYSFSGWFLDKQYKKQIKNITAGTSGNISVYAKWKKLKEYAPKSNSARITSCKGSGVDKIYIKAKITKRIKSTDSYYYLVTVDPASGKILKRAAKSPKKTSVSFTLNTAEPNKGYIMAKYAIAVKQKKGYKVISSSKYVTSPENTAQNRHTYETGKTKKGIQFTTTQDVERVDAKNTFLNLYASTILSNPDTTYKYNGKTYRFNSLRGYEIAVSEFNSKGINVTLQLGLDWGDGSYQDLIAPEARSEGHILYTWNTSNKAAREKMEAIFSFLASKFSTSDCLISNWVLGNEVNSCNLWNYKGSMSKNKFINSYSYAFRSLYNAAKSNWNNSKVFICLDHCWNTADAGYTAKDFMNSFAKKIKSMQSGIDWNVAFHAYPAPLTSPDFWNNSAISSKEDSPYVTMENIQVLTNYVKKHYGSNTRIILSEQGFSSSKGEDVQAAAIAYGYYKAACNPMIDSFIIRSYADEPGETAQGLYMGISGKKAYNVFKYMDTKNSGKYTNKYLKTIGKSSWKKAVPGYTPNRIYKMYRK